MQQCVNKGLINIARVSDMYACTCLEHVCMYVTRKNCIYACTSLEYAYVQGWNIYTLIWLGYHVYMHAYG